MERSRPPWKRLGAAVQNALEIARLGAPAPTERTPYEIVTSDPFFRLRRYGPGGAADDLRPAIVLVPPLMLTAEVYDISAGASAVAALIDGGVDPWVVDFGAPERQEGGLRRTLADHVLAVSRAVDRVRKETGRDAHLGGYSQGGMFCYQTAAYRRSEGIASLVTFGSPVDVHRNLPPGLPEDLAVRLIGGFGSLLASVFAGTAVPAWMSRTAFRMMSPMKELQSQLEFVTRLTDREAMRRREEQRRFLAGEGWVAWPGPALRDFVDQFLVHNRMLSGGFVVESRVVTLADITCPVLVFVGETDEIARPATVRSVVRAAPRAEIWERSMRAGHFGLVVGSKAMKESWPEVIAWLHWREGIAARPPSIVRVEEPAATDGDVSPDVGYSLELAFGLGQDVLRTFSTFVGESASALRSLAGNVIRQAPRLARLESLRRDTRIGLGLALAEQAESNPDGTFFLFEGRAYSHADADRRVDAVVRGLLSMGVGAGDSVGILMRSRPSALALTAAVNRLGAVAVLLRPDGDRSRELAIGAVEHLIADPEHGEAALAAFGRPVHVLGGGGGPRTLPPGLVDLEAVDPAAVTLPAWYEPNPGRSEEVAFVLFSGRGERVRANQVTNRRWALSAFGTATAAALGPGDTIYDAAPVQHATGLLVAVGGALAGGARLALAERFSRETFWDEVRRYGVTVVVYAGTMCRDLVYARHDPAERHHPVRLFAGSGMPRPVWRRLVERFGPVSVLEFYASTEGEAILANLTGRKVGSVGRPLPGSPEVALAAWDAASGGLVHEASGFRRRAGEGETGLLLARVDRERGAREAKVLRNVFERGDAWTPTEDLFRRDRDGDYWLVDHVPDLIRTRDGALPSIPIEEAVWELDGVTAAVAYGAAPPGSRHELPVVGVTLAPDARLDPAALRDIVERDLEPESRPAVIRILDTIPMTGGYRFLKQPLRAEGIDPAGMGEGALVRDSESGEFRPLDAEALRSLSLSPRRRRRAKSG